MIKLYASIVMGLAVIFLFFNGLAMTKNVNDMIALLGWAIVLVCPILGYALLDNAREKPAERVNNEESEDNAE